MFEEALTHPHFIFIFKSHFYSSNITYTSGKGYGIALKPGSGLKNALDTGILKMMEGGDLYKV